MAANALPTLSEVRAFTGDYLINAASHWSDSAAGWSDAYDDLARGVVRPAGAEWRGEAAEAAARRVGTDRRRVDSAADELTAAASTARRAVDDLRAAKANLLSTVRAADAAGFEVGEDFSLTSRESTTSAKALAGLEAQARRLGLARRSDFLALVKADEDAAAQISRAATGLRTLDFRGVDGVASDRTAIQAVDFHGTPLPEKPPNPPAIPPPEGWSPDPLMRAAQKIAYGHASDKKTGHMADFPGMTKAQLAELVYQKMQRAITDPTGLILGGSDTDGVPVIYEPKDNVLIVRDTRPNAPDGGTVFKPDLEEDPNFATDKFGSYRSIFTPDELADGAPPGSSVSEPRRANFGVPGGVTQSGVDEAPGGGTLPDWGTHISPDEAAKHDGEIGNLGKILLGLLPPDPNDPDNMA